MPELKKFNAPAADTGIIFPAPTPSISGATLSDRAFTLIELSIVLVVIGLLVGGVLVGQDLIRAAGERAQITQMEKFQSAVATFYEKYGYLPGDIPAAPAAQFGFIARGTSPGQGDGNGLLQGWWGAANGNAQAEGETAVFWVDLSTAGLIEGGFHTAASASGAPANATGVAINNWFPSAKIAQGNYIYVLSPNGASAPAGISYNSNYFGLSAVSSITSTATTTPGLTVKQAYDIDTKIDDGFPQSGNVVAWYLLGGTGFNWAAGGGNNGAWGTSIAAGSPTTCYDNSSDPSGSPGVSGAVQHYSIEMYNGSLVNCALSFKFQTGD